MPKPSLEDEVSEFSIRNKKSLRCCINEPSTCGTCDRCELREQLTEIKTWFPRVGNNTKKKLILGLVKRIYNSQVLKYLSRLLKPATYKDFTYARNRSKPSLKNDELTLDCDRAVPAVQIEAMMYETWKWFQNTSNWTKCIFLFHLLNTCDSHLLHLVGTEAQTLIEPAFYHDVHNDDACVQVFDSRDMNSELEIVIGTNKAEDIFCHNGTDDVPNITCNNIISNGETTIELGDDGYNLMHSEIDPTFFVIAGCAKSYSGVSVNRDFIRLLPVNLSKYILGMLDQATLYNCLCVSRNWKAITDEVIEEFYINQNLNEEVMLLQGAAAHGCNPIYAKDIDVTVPNIDGDSLEILPYNLSEQDRAIEKTTSFRSIYKGYSTRNIIMEERNVYCGAYNVMVVIDKYDPARVIHTNGEKYIALGSSDRHVSLIDMSTGYQVGPSMTGHAGSIKCLYLDEKRSFIISGSYDTSLRMWSTETRKPMKIFRGHTGTVLCVAVLGDLMVSGSKDQTCKVWNLNEKMALKTFNHRHSVTAVAVSDELCISGCEGGKVKVWYLKRGKLIKILSGHHGQITAIKLDRWHIITGGKDGFVLVWSAQGNFNGCLMALRHPKEVLSLEFQYLRIISASADGKLRIWNMISGQCLRIMRGNSGSDPILQLMAIENRLTVNTSRNLLVLNFESVIFDYSLENDKIPPLVHYSNYSYAPVRHQSSTYVRRNRMKASGASNGKIIHHHDHRLFKSKSYGNIKIKNINHFKVEPQELKDIMTPETKIKRILKCPVTEVKVKTQKVKQTESHLSRWQSELDQNIENSSIPLDHIGRKKRRVSWAFETSLNPVASRFSLSDTKALLRAQIRTPDTVIPPDFVYLTIRSMESHMRLTDSARCEENHCHDNMYTKLGRPSSSPSKLDSRRKIRKEDFPTQIFLGGNSVQDSSVNANFAVYEEIFREKSDANNDLDSKFADLSVNPKSHRSYDKLSNQMLSKYLFRPHTASNIRKPKYDLGKRPKSAIDRRELVSNFNKNDENVLTPYIDLQNLRKQSASRTNSRHFMQNCNIPHSKCNGIITTTSKDPSLVPMLMFSNEKK